MTFDPNCLYCGARIIQLIGRLQITPEAATRRRKEALAVWVAQGHSSAEIRALVRGPAALEPVIAQPKARRK